LRQGFETLCQRDGARVSLHATCVALA